MASEIEFDPSGPGTPPTPEQLAGTKQTLQLDNVPNIDATDCDNHVSGINNKVFTESNRDQIVQNALDITVLQASSPVSADETFNYYLKHFSSIPTPQVFSGSGSVIAFTLGGVTRYLFIPDPYDPTQEAFYENFSDPVLSNLIVRRDMQTV